MTKEREALKLALEALEDIGDEWGFTSQRTVPKRKEAITAIKEALAQPEQEPVGWAEHGVINWLADKQFNHTSFLYATPPQRKPLTDEEIILIVAECAASHQHTDIHFARAIEAAHGIKGLV